MLWKKNDFSSIFSLLLIKEKKGASAPLSLADVLQKPYYSSARNLPSLNIWMVTDFGLSIGAPTALAQTA